MHVFLNVFRSSSVELKKLYKMFDQKVDELCCGHSFILVVRFLLGNAVPRLAEAPPHLAECLRESEKLSRNEVSPFFARLDFSCSLHRLKPAFMMIILMKRLVLADLHHRKFFFFFPFLGLHGLGPSVPPC